MGSLGFALFEHPVVLRPVKDISFLAER